MACAGSDPASADAGIPVLVKMVIAGGFGVGKTSLVQSVSEIHPLRTEEELSPAGRALDPVDAVRDKATTTVAMDFGRVTLFSDLVLYLFGMPGQERFWFMWDELAYGAIGAVILADTRRLAECFAAVDYFERAGTPFIIAVNCFDGAARYAPEAIRAALDLDAAVPVLLCDVRDRHSAINALVTLAGYVTRLVPAGGTA